MIIYDKKYKNIKSQQFQYPIGHCILRPG